MKGFLRGAAGVVVGLAVLIALVIGVELFSSVVHPFPEGFGGTEEEICRHVERYPDWVLAVAAAMWGGAALLGVWTARRVGNAASAVIVGVLLLAALAMNLSMLPYPIWFKIACLVLIPVAAFVGGRRPRVRKYA